VADEKQGAAEAAQDEEQARQVAELEQLAQQADGEPLGGEYVPGDEPAPDGPAGNIETGEILAPVLQITFGVIAAKRGAHWALTDAEAVELGRAYGAVLDKYFPDAANRFGVEITAIMVTAAAFGPRLIEDKRKAAEREARQEAQGQEAAGGVDGDSSE